MKNGFFLVSTMFVVGLLAASCSDPIKEELQKPKLSITLKNDTGKSIVGAVVRLYKDIADTGYFKISDSSGKVLFTDLEPVLYYWFAKKDCLTNRTSQTTLNRPLNPGAIHYGYSVMAETGTLNIINNSIDKYRVSDSVMNQIIAKDTPYLAHRRVKSFKIHVEKVQEPRDVGKDTLIFIKCGDTSVLKIPF